MHQAYQESHKKLLVWQKGVELVTMTYRFTADFPETERFGLVMQMRRAAVPVVSNIAEGAARRSRKEKAQFFITGRGSLSELDTQLIVSEALGFGLQSVRQALIEKIGEVARLLNGLIASQQR
jgi:four helix bundle protein